MLSKVHVRKEQLLQEIAEIILGKATLVEAETQGPLNIKHIKRELARMDVKTLEVMLDKYQTIVRNMEKFEKDAAEMREVRAFAIKNS